MLTESAVLDLRQNCHFDRGNFLTFVDSCMTNNIDTIFTYLQSRLESPVNVRDSVRSLRSQEGGGWNIPDETEVSMATNWSERKYLSGNCS